jgi:hypothetical protein
MLPVYEYGFGHGEQSKAGEEITYDYGKEYFDDLHQA